jgi:opacity protein-like surface antigen
VRPTPMVVRTAALVICVLVPVVSAGQSFDRGPRLGGIVSGSFGDGGPSPSIAISGGYRFNSRLGLEADISYSPKLDFGELPACPPERFCVAIIGGTVSLRGEAVSLAANLVSELPVGARWIRPYVVGGAGVAHVRREMRHTFYLTGSTVTATSPLLTAGGGVEFLLGRRLGVGVDLRYQRIFGEDQFGRPDIDHNLNLTRLGSSVSYRF